MRAHSGLTSQVAARSDLPATNRGIHPRSAQIRDGFVAAFVLLLALPSSFPSMAARIDDSRVMATDRIDAMRGLQALVLMPQKGVGIFVEDPRMGPQPTVSSALVTNPSITGGTFAGGAAAGAAGALIGGAIIEAQWESIRDQAENMLFAMGAPIASEDHSIAWLSAIAKNLETSKLFAGEKIASSTETHEMGAAGGPCPLPDECMLLSSRWGLSQDGRHLEMQTAVLVWSAALRSGNARPRAKPDYYNVLLYRSAPTDLPDQLSDSDREALRASAKGAYQSRGISELIKSANSSNSAESKRARKRANRLLVEHRQRLKQAEAKTWTDESSAIRRSQIWAEQDGAALSLALTEAQSETLKMLEIELSKAGQAAKVQDKFKWRNRQAIYKVISAGPRQIAYLHEGTLVSELAEEPLGGARGNSLFMLPQAESSAPR